jgi:hypothetical protein
MAASKRPLRVPTRQISQAEFMRLQAHYDAELRASGFRDIEDGSDLNLIDGSTFRRPSNGGHGAEVKIGCGVGTGRSSGYSQRMGIMHSDGLADDVSVFDSPRARAWMRFSQAAHELPTDAEMRAILIDVADTGSLTESSIRNGVSERTVYDRVTRLCAAIGIGRRCLLGAVTDTAAPPEPMVTPARRLTKKEIRRLNYEPPMARKAS